MPLPLTVSCFSKIQIGFTFLVPAHLGSPGKGPLNGCVCVWFITKLLKINDTHAHHLCQWMFLGLLTEVLHDRRLARHCWWHWPDTTSLLSSHIPTRWHVCPLTTVSLYMITHAQRSWQQFSMSFKFAIYFYMTETYICLHSAEQTSWKQNIHSFATVFTPATVKIAYSVLMRNQVKHLS